MRPHASVLRGSRRPRRHQRELIRLLRCDDYLFAPKRACKYEPLTDEFMPQLRDLVEDLRERRARAEAIDALYGEWDVTLEQPSH